MVNDDAQSKIDIRNPSVYKGRLVIYGLEYRSIYNRDAMTIL